MKTLLVFMSLLCVGMAQVTPVPEPTPFPYCDGGMATLEEYWDYFDGVIAPDYLRFWHSKADYVNGGYNIEADSKHLVGQSRLVWVFSTAILKGFEVDGLDNLKAAQIGVDFLLDHFLDTEYGGYYWGTDNVGNVIDDGKYLYGESFALYALARYYRVTSDERAKTAGIELLKVIQDKATENVSSIGGYYENFSRDWVLYTEGDGPVSPYDTKTANFIMHWMEALTEATIAFDDMFVRSVLEVNVDDYVVAFYPDHPEDSIRLTDLQGNEVLSGEDFDGHLVEYGWLRMEALNALGRDLEWYIFDNYFDYVTSRIDPDIGGVNDEEGGYVWWAQGELLSAYSVNLQLRGVFEKESILLNNLNYIICKFIDDTDSILYWSLTEEGEILDGTKASRWKAGFHAYRGISKFVRAFEGVSK